MNYTASQKIAQFAIGWGAVWAVSATIMMALGIIPA